MKDLYLSIPHCSIDFVVLPQYDKIGKLTRDFEQLNNLWITAADWLKWYKTWMNDSLINIDPELLANNVNNAFKTMHKSVKHFGCVITIHVAGSLHE